MEKNEEEKKTVKKKQKEMPKAARIKIRNKTGKNVWFRVSYPGDLPGLFDYQESVVPGSYDQVRVFVRNVDNAIDANRNNRSLSRFQKEVLNWNGWNGVRMMSLEMMMTSNQYKFIILRRL